MPAKNMPYRKKQRALAALSRRLARYAIIKPSDALKARIFQEIKSILDKYPDSPDRLQALKVLGNLV